MPSRAILKTIIFGLFALFCASPLSASPYNPDCIVKFGISGPVCVDRAVAKGFHQARHFGTYTKAPKSVRNAQKKKQAKVAKSKPARTIKTYAKHQTSSTGRFSLNGFPSALVAKVRELESECGARLVSAFRPGAKVRGSGRPSLHASRRAVDMAGPPKCIYARMRNWRGGMSVDYRAVNHIHISWAPGSGEWGSKFSHWRPRKTGVGG